MTKEIRLDSDILKDKLFDTSQFQESYDYMVIGDTYFGSAILTGKTPKELF